MIKLDVGLTITDLNSAIDALATGDSITAAAYTERALNQILSHAWGSPIEVVPMTSNPIINTEGVSIEVC